MPAEALAMPGVKGMITMDDLPAPADSVTDLGAVIKANPRGERGLAMEPVYQGEPILALAAVDELTAADAIEKIKVKYEPLPFVVDPFVSLRPGGPNARTDGNTWMRKPAPPPAPGATPGPSARSTSPKSNGPKRISRTTPKAKCPWASPPTSGPTAIWTRVSRTRLWFSMKRLLRRTPATSAWKRAPPWLTGRTASCSCTPARKAPCRRFRAIARWMNMKADDVVLISEYTGGGFGSKVTGIDSNDYSRRFLRRSATRR